MKYLKVLPLIIAFVLVSAHFIQVSLWNLNAPNEQYEFQTSVIVGAFGVGLSAILVILQKEIWKVFFLGVILLAFTPLLQFYHQTFYFGIGSLDIELTALALLLIHFAINHDFIILIKNFFSTASENEVKTNKVEHFKAKFEKKSTDELKDIIHDKNRTSEAKEAAQNILKKAK